MNRETTNALERFEEIASRVNGRAAAVFLDFDGTLTPIVARPERAVLSAEMRAIIVHLAQACVVAIVSGRDLEDVRERVHIEGLWYAGSHGFDIAGPLGVRLEYPKGLEALPALDAAEQALRAALGDIEGALVERKRFSVAIHFRLTPEWAVPAVERAVERVLGEQPALRRGHGKKVFELLPDVEWNKGAAVDWLLQSLDMNRPDSVPMYIGDDATDEDAFRVLADRGIGIAVFEHPRATFASYRLRNPHEVREFLLRLTGILERTPPGRGIT